LPCSCYNCHHHTNIPVTDTCILRRENFSWEMRKGDHYYLREVRIPDLLRWDDGKWLIRWRITEIPIDIETVKIQSNLSQRPPMNSDPCLQQLPFWGPILNFFSMIDLWTTTTCQKKPATSFGLYTNLTAYQYNYDRGFWYLENVSFYLTIRWS
jgi:hypothetical protein